MWETNFKDEIKVDLERTTCLESGSMNYAYFPKLITEYGEEVYIKNASYPNSILHSKDRLLVKNEAEKVLKRFRERGAVIKDENKLEQSMVKARRLTADDIIFV